VYYVVKNSTFFFKPQGETTDLHLVSAQNFFEISLTPSFIVLNSIISSQMDLNYIIFIGLVIVGNIFFWFKGGSKQSGYGKYLNLFFFCVYVVFIILILLNK